jgi:hypothetical protein
MNLVSTYRHNWKRTNVQLVSLACGLALAAAVISGYEVLRDKENTTTISPARVAQPVGPVMDEPDFGSVGIDFTLNGLPAQTAAAAGLQDARGIGQPGEGVQSVEATLIDPTDFGSLGIESALQPQFGSLADAAHEAETYATALEATLIDPTDFGYLGIGQSGEGAAGSIVEGSALDALWHAEILQVSGSPQNRTSGDAAVTSQTAVEARTAAATLIDPTDFASSFANHRAAQQFGTQADAVYATEGWVSRASEAPLFGTMVDAVYVMEGDIQLQ